MQTFFDKEANVVRFSIPIIIDAYATLLVIIKDIVTIIPMTMLSPQILLMTNARLREYAETMSWPFTFREP